MGHRQPTPYLQRFTGLLTPWPRGTLLVALLSVSTSASTDQASTSLGVNATVVAVARVELTNREPELIVTAEDLNRGYVDCPDPLKLTIYSNSRKGYTLDVLPISPMFTTVSVQGLGSDISLPSGGGTVTQRWAHPQSVSLTLKFSFVLADGVQPGRYPWPVRLAARPLAQ